MLDNCSHELVVSFFPYVRSCSKSHDDADSCVAVRCSAFLLKR